MKNVKNILIVVAVVFAAILLLLALVPLYVLREGEQAVIVQFGKIVRVDTEAGVAEAADHAAEGTHPPSDLNGSADYRRHLAAVLTRRAVLKATEP